MYAGIRPTKGQLARSEVLNLVVCSYQAGQTAISGIFVLCFVQISLLIDFNSGAVFTF